MFLFLDTETTGLGDTARLVSVCWVICDDDGREVFIEYYVIRPSGFTIHPAAIAKHGITNDTAAEAGVPIKQVLRRLYIATTESPYLCCVGHNLKFDLKVTLREYSLLDLKENLSRLPRICTMKETRRLCALSNGNGKAGFKAPTLQELHRFLFEQEYARTHDAVADARACARCFFELDRRGLITRPLSLGYG